MCPFTYPKKPKEAHMATCCHFLAVGQLYGFSGSFSQSDAFESDESAFSLWATLPFSILSTATSLSVADPDTVLSLSGSTDSPNPSPLSFSGLSLVVVLSIPGHRVYRAADW